MDDQTADFFAGMDAPPPVPSQQPPVDFDDNDFMMDFASAPTPGNPPPPPPPDNFIGVVEDVPDEDNAFVLTGAPPAGEEPIILGGPSSYEPMGEAIPPSTDAPIILGEAPPPVLVEAAPGELAPAAPISHEPSPLAKWNDEWQAILKERKETENAMKAEQVKAARAETDKFMEERTTKISSRKNTNRVSEEEKLKTMQEDLEKDNCWERVVKLVDLTQDSVEKSAEIKRMRDMIILLKNDKDRAALLS